MSLNAWGRLVLLSVLLLIAALLPGWTQEVKDKKESKDAKKESKDKK